MNFVMKPLVQGNNYLSIQIASIFLFLSILNCYTTDDSIEPGFTLFKHDLSFLYRNFI